MNPHSVTPNAAEILARTGFAAEDLVARALARLHELPESERELGRVDFDLYGQPVSVVMEPDGDGSDARIMAENDEPDDSGEGRS